MSDFDILCQTTVPLRSYEDPTDFVVEYSGIIRHHSEEGEITKVGEFSALKVLLGLAANYGEDVFDIFDAHSQGLHNIYAALFDGDEPKAKVQEQFDCFGSDLLIIHDIVLDRQWRGLKLGLLAVRRLIDLLNGDCALVVCEPYPSENAEMPEERRRGMVTLRRYFKKLGFQRIAKTPYYGLSVSRVMPTFEDILQQGVGVK